jgi:hypothetical protein
VPIIQRTEKLDDIEYGKGNEVPATEERTLAVGGQQYRTYLTAENAKTFDDDLARWTEHAEKVSTSKARRQGHSHSGSAGTSNVARRPQDKSAAIRAWAMTQEFNPPVSERGRIPDKVVQAYYKTFPEERDAS